MVLKDRVELDTYVCFDELSDHVVLVHPEHLVMPAKTKAMEQHADVTRGRNKMFTKKKKRGILG